MSVPSRTTQALVEGVLLDDYNQITTPDLTPFIAGASAIVDQVVYCANRKRVCLDAAVQELVERWLAAHAYCCSDQPYKGRHTLRASGQFQGQTKMGVEGTKYGQFALLLDPSGCLNNFDKNARVRAFWGGRHHHHGWNWGNWVGWGGSEVCGTCTTGNFTPT